MEIKIQKGLNLPLKNGAEGSVSSLDSQRAALDVSAHDSLHFQLLAKVGDQVREGDPLLADKSCTKRVFVAPASGRIAEIVRGEKRRILSVVIEIDPTIEAKRFDSLALDDGLIHRLLEGGLFGSIIQRPCAILADPEKKPEAIFVNALASEPYLPNPQLELDGKDELFREGLKALSTLAQVHLVGLEGYDHITCHTARGPHPIANPSIHIQKIHPIRKPDQIVWTLTVHEVIAVGSLIRGEFYHERVIAIAGNGVKPGKTGFFHVQGGACIADLLKDRLIEEPVRIISGSPLTGQQVGMDGFLGASHTAITALKESQKRSFLHFLGLGRKRYTATKAYLSSKNQDFSTLLHGEPRAFVDGSYYDKYLPMRIPVMPLIKAIMAEDFEKAVNLGLLEVAPEDFALPAFVCPSKINMPDIVRRGQQLYADQYIN